jgi:hypothetical protein
MNGYQWAGLILTFASVVGIPLLAMTIRGSIKWTRVEAKIDNVFDDVKGLILNNEKAREREEKVHLLMMEDIRQDRAATNVRLRWLEENLWLTKGANSAVPSEGRRGELPRGQFRNRRSEGHT